MKSQFLTDVSQHRCFLHSQPSFVFRLPFRLLCARLAVHSVAVLSVLRSFIGKLQRATATRTMAVYVSACGIIICSFLCRFLSPGQTIATFQRNIVCHPVVTCRDMLGV